MVYIKEFVEEKEELCKNMNEFGWTVAHEQAKQGWRTKDKEILELTDKIGRTVKDILFLSVFRFS